MVDPSHGQIPPQEKCQNDNTNDQQYFLWLGQPVLLVAVLLVAVFLFLSLIGFSVRLFMLFLPIFRYRRFISPVLFLRRYAPAVRDSFLSPVS